MMTTSIGINLVVTGYWYACGRSGAWRSSGGVAVGHRPLPWREQRIFSYSRHGVRPSCVGADWWRASSRSGNMEAVW